MRKRLNDCRLQISDFRLSGVMWALMAILVVAGTAAHATAGSPSPKSEIVNHKSEIPKWDAGQKDLLTSMEDEAARRPLSGSESGAKEEPVYVTLLSFIFKLAVVVALAYGTIYALKRLNVSAFKRSSVGGIRVVENTSLGANRSLHVVEVGGKRLLVASTPNQVNLLTELEVDSEQCTVDSGEGSAPSGTVNRQPSTANSFRDHLSAFMGARPNTGDSASNVAQIIRGSSTFLQEKIVELGRLRRKMRDA